MEMANPGLPTNNICSTLAISGRLDVALLQRAIATLIAASPALRTRITREGGQPVQHITQDVPATVPFFDFSLTGHEGVNEWALSVAREAMPVVDSPLFYCAAFKRESGAGGVLLKTHHIISDAWSQGLLLNRLANSYLALLSEKEADAEPSPLYRPHVESEQQYLQSPQKERDVQFWQSTLVDLPDTQIKPFDHPTISAAGSRLTFALPERLNRLVNVYCEKARVSPFAVFALALAVYLGRVRGQRRFCIGVPVINRSTFQEKQTVGMYVSTLPFVSEIDDAQSLQDFNERFQADWYEMLRHQRLPYPEIRAIAQANGHPTGKLFDVVVSYQNGGMVVGEDSRVSFEGRWQYSGYQAETLCIHISSRAGDGRYLVDYDYLTQIFSTSEIEVLHGFLTNLMLDALSNPQKPIKQLRVLSEAEEERVLYGFNATQAPLPGNETLADALLRQARTHETRAALIYEGERIQYGALLACAQMQAEAIRAAVPQGGQVIAIWLPRGVELFIAMCAVILSGNAWLFVGREQPEARVQAMLESCGAAAVLSPEGIECRAVTKAFAPPPEDDPIAYVVCTSGSTGEPKGVQVGQRSLLNFARAMRDVYGHGGILSACNVGFDAFIIESISALLNARTVILAPEKERNNPAVLARLIRGYAAGFLSLTPSRLQAYLKEPQFAQALASVDTILCGGETYPEELVARLQDLTEATLYNQYGPSEATVGVSLLRLNDAAAITIGRPMRNCQLYILDAMGKPLPVGAVGEICVGGLCLAHGYRGDPDLTARRFVENPYREGRLYHTGDLGMWNARGEIVYQGRKDGQVKLHGHRIEVGEVEARLALHPDISGVAVRLYTQAGHTFLAAYYAATGVLLPNVLLSFASAYLPRYMLPTYLQQVEALPVNANGKTDYNRLPQPILRLGNEGPANDVEARLLDIWRRVLRNPGLDVNTDYFMSGGDSLNALEVLMEMEQVLGKAPTMADLYANSTVRRLAACFQGTAVPPQASAAADIPAAPALDAYPLTPAQQRFYVLQNMDERGMAYNMPGAFRPSGHIDIGRLEMACRQLVTLDEQLRTGFVIENGTLAQKIAPEVSFAVTRLEAGDFASAYAAFVRPFDLAKPPLFRVGVWMEAPDSPLLFFDMHHIISDGITSALLFERLGTLYRGEKPEMPVTRYRDWAYHLAQADPSRLDAQRTYWQAQLKGAPNATDLPYDYARAASFDGAGAKHRFMLSKALSDACDRYCEKQQATPYGLFAATFGLLLSRLSQQSDIVVGTPVSGRRHAQLQRVSGVFINTLPLRMRVPKEATFGEYLRAVRDTAAAMLDHQDLRFDEIVALTGVQREAGHNPLYNVMFSMAPIRADAFTLGDTALSPVEMESDIAKLDLSLEGVRGADRYTFTFAYAASYLTGDTVEIWARSFEAMLQAIVTQPDVDIASVPCVSPRDALRLIERPNRRRVPFDNTPIDRLVDEMALVMPDEPAVLWGDGKSYTFAELKTRSDGIARHLVSEGMQPGDIIGMLVRRDGDLLATQLGIWKAGCVQIPLDTAYPPARIRTMLETAGAAALLCGESVAAPEDMPCRILSVGSSDAPVALPQRGDAGLAYILFTSGSTGHPKGVMIAHRALSNLLLEGEQILGNSQRVLCAANVIFDIYATETWQPLVQGKTVVMADEEEMLLPWKMAARMEASGVDFIELTPSRMQMCLADASFAAAMGHVEGMMMAGEPIPESLMEALRKVAPRARILNGYGPTEATVIASWADLTREKSVHIGRPNANCRFYTLDAEGRMVPPTALGELYIAGECLSPGYINRPELTEAAFLPDPFVPGDMMYKTGDMARLRPDGCWDFRGRRDRQIKLGGHRIELEEIHACILRSGCVKEAAVVPMEQDGTIRSLRACVVPGDRFTRDTLHTYLTVHLADYMVPSEILAVEALPRTASGKTDIRALAALSANETPVQKQERPQAPAIDMGNPLMTIWCDVLQRDSIDENLSFFKQGGNSLLALMILNHYYRSGWTMSMNDFYRHPTLCEHMQQLGIAEKPAVPAVPQQRVKRQRLPRYIPAQNADSPKQGDILITGASGYFGAHLLDALRRQEGRILCLVRDEARFQAAHRAYFGRSADDVTVIHGDITLPRFGLPFTAYAGLAAQVATIWHCAADVRHYAPEEELQRANVTGTETMIAFAQDAQAWLGHISTGSISANHLEDAPDTPAHLTEADLDMGQDWWCNAYVRSKAMAEAKVVAAMEAGLSGQIFRLGRISARASDGVFQINPETNAFYRTIRGLIEMGAAPASWADVPLELTPVDLSVEATLRLHGTEATALHIVSPQTILPSELLARIGGVAILPDDAFAALLKARMERDTSPYVNALAALFFTERSREPKVQLDMTQTIGLLLEKGFSWPPLNPETQARCFTKS